MDRYIVVHKDHELQKIVIASAFLHVLFIAFLALPNMAKEAEHKSFFVDLVAPIEIQETFTPASMQALPEIKNKIAKQLPEKDNQADMTQINKPMPGEYNTAKRGYEAPDELSSGSLPQIKNIETVSDQKFGTVSNYQAEKIKYHQDPILIDRGYSGTPFTAREELQSQKYMIAKAEAPVKKEYAARDRGSDLYGSSGTDFKKSAEFGSSEKQAISKNIERPGSSRGTGKRDDVYAEQKEHSGAGMEGILSGNDKLISAGIRASGVAFGQGASPGIIERPGFPGGTGTGGNVNSLRNEKTGTGGGGSSDGNADASTTDISIKGVPLNDLIACSNALDEGLLKNKILNAIGQRRECFNPSSGRFLFQGTDRYTSFEMIIMPSPGRKLSNRCGELKNALVCLRSTKD